MAEPDLDMTKLALGLIGAAGTIAAIWLGLQKERRDRASTTPVVGWHAERLSARHIAITVEVENTTRRTIRPIILRPLAPEGMALVEPDAGGPGGPASIPRVDLAPGWGVPFGDLALPPGERWTRRASLLILEEFAAPTPITVQVALDMHPGDARAAPRTYKFRQTI